MFKCAKAQLVWRIAPVQQEGIQGSMILLKSGGGPREIVYREIEYKKDWKYQLTFSGNYGRQEIRAYSEGMKRVHNGS